MQKDYIIDQLSLEITRRCNMTCEHCLRGNAQKMDIDVTIFNSLFSRIKRINCLTFTGGEPSLRPRLMMLALGMAKHYKVDVEQVYIVTNGKNVTQEFLNVCLEWHKYTIECQYNYAMQCKVIDGDMAMHIISTSLMPDRTCGCYVSLSMDRFHEPIEPQNILKLLTLPNLLTEKYEKPSRTNDWVLNTGRAKENGIGLINMEVYRPYMYDGSEKTVNAETTCFSNDVTEIEIESLYVSADGTLLKHCDYPYAEQKEHACGTIQKGYDPDWIERMLGPDSTD